MLEIRLNCEMAKYIFFTPNGLVHMGNTRVGNTSSQRGGRCQWRHNVLSTNEKWW